MSDMDDKKKPGDDELVAYLDGELADEERKAVQARINADPAVKARLDHLATAGRNFAAAFEHLFEIAPAERMAAMLKQVEADNERRAAKRGSGFRLGLIAAGLALFIVGGFGGFILGQTNGGDADEASTPGYWREVVAEYVTLYSTETFAGIPDDKAMLTAGLAAVGGKLGLDLTPAKVALPGLSLKGPILFTFRGMPLAQVAYLVARARADRLLRDRQWPGRPADDLRDARGQEHRLLGEGRPRLSGDRLGAASRSRGLRRHAQRKRVVASAVSGAPARRSRRWFPRSGGAGESSRRLRPMSSAG